MGKVGRLRNRDEPFAALFWALDNVPWYKPTPEPERHGPASLHRCTQSMFLYCMVIVGSILNKDAPSPPLFLFKYSARF